MRIIVPFLCLLLAGCVRVPSISASEAAGIESAAFELMPHAGSRDLPRQKWPKEIQVLGAQSVRITPEGVYIVTSSFFVEEAGLFVPRQVAAFSPPSGGHPEYAFEHGHVFSYRIRG